MSRAPIYTLFNPPTIIKWFENEYWPFFIEAFSGNTVWGPLVTTLASLDCHQRVNVCVDATICNASVGLGCLSIKAARGERNEEKLSFSGNLPMLKGVYISYISKSEIGELDGRAVSALGVRSRKLST
jgi:hypothetical protein